MSRWNVIHDNDVMGHEAFSVEADSWYEARAKAFAFVAAEWGNYEPTGFKVTRRPDPIQKLIPAAAKMREPITVKAVRARR